MLCFIAFGLDLISLNANSLEASGLCRSLSRQIFAQYFRFRGEKKKKKKKMPGTSDCRFSQSYNSIDTRKAI